MNVSLLLRTTVGILLPIFILLLPSPDFAETLQTTANLQRIEIKPDNLQVYVDKTKRMEFDEIRNQSFSKTQTSSFGYSPHVHWVKFSIHNQYSDEKLLLELAYPVIDYIDVYVINSNNRVTHQISGDHRPFKKREILHRNFIFNIFIPIGTTAEVFLRVRTQSATSLPLRLWSPNSFLQNDHSEQAALMLYYGAIIMMMLYNISLFFYLRDSSYFFYVIYILLISLTLAVQNGIAFEYLWSSQVWWNNHAQSITVIAGSTAIILFCRSFLQTRTTFPKMNLILLYYAMITATLAIVALFIPLSISLRIASIVVLISAILSITTGIIVLSRGFIIARFYLLAWTFLLIGAILAAIRNFGIIPHNEFTTYSLQIGSALEILLLSFGLGYRINLLRAEKEKEKREITESVARFVPTEFLKYLGATDIRQVEFGTAVEQDFTVLFTDIRSFTTMSEQMSVEDNFKFLNSYLKRMVPLIHQNDGIIDKFIGDAILALFARSPEDAVRAAVDLRKQLNHYNQYRIKHLGFQPIDTGSGLHTGKLMLGTVGFDKKSLKDNLNVPESVRDRLDTTVIGDTVNISARLQDLNKVYGTSILISETIHNVLPESMRIYSREIDRIRVRGKVKNTKIYEIFEGDRDELRDEKLKNLAHYLLARNLLKAGEINDAYNEFIKLKTTSPSDPLIVYYIKRTRKMIEIQTKSV